MHTTRGPKGREGGGGWEISREKKDFVGERLVESQV